MKRTAHVIGGGIGGLAAGAALARRGWGVTIHERAAELREIGAGIFLKENSIRVLEQLECFDAVIAAGSRLRRSEIRNRHGRPILSRNVGTERVYTVLREDLHRELARAAMRWGARIATSSEVVEVDIEGGLRTASGDAIRADLIVGADGLGSLARSRAGLEARAGRMPNGSTRVLVPRAAGDPTDGSIELWRGHKRVMVVPVGNAITYYCATCREDDARGAASPFDVEYWSAAFPEFRSLFERTDPTKTVHHTHGTVRVRGWSNGRIAILGDAVHGQPPNLGQGAGLAISNGGALADRLDQGDLASALREWERDCRPMTEHVQRWSENWDYFVHQWPIALEGIRSSVIWTLANFPPTRRHWGKIYRGIPFDPPPALSKPSA